MKKLLKILGGVLGLVVLAVGGFLLKVQLGGIPHYTPERVTLTVESTPERVARGRNLSNALCAGCHMNVATGRLTGADMKADDPFGKVWSYNITRHPTAGIGSWSDAELAVLLRTGIARDGRYTPPWMAKLPHLSDEDLASVIAYLRSDDPVLEPSDVANVPSEPSFLSKFLCNVAFKPLPYPTKPIPQPDHSDPVAWGRYLTWNLDCYTCHSADFAKIDAMNPPASAGFMGGGNLVEGVVSPNLTPDPETGIGKWSEADFVRALRQGVRPDDTGIRYPMNAYSMLSVDEAKAIFAYLKTVPTLKNAVQRTPGPKITPEMEAGKKVYLKYACVSCHGEGGLGNCDLTKNRAHFATDDELAAFIGDPSATVPGSRMPAWKNVIQGEELQALLQHVRSLDKTPPDQVKAAGGSR
ncbi:MAG: c-type cytochrome [Myxococcaceae bacterium]|nr:c-type cytochrome [Myxococcaceae bacterium]